ncbi:hypothetical protein PspR76_08055 [Pseudomonas sp. R76]|nr:hypothetical protein PspR76_08055 [Pseudomonas sp. R76]
MAAFPRRAWERSHIQSNFFYSRRLLPDKPTAPARPWTLSSPGPKASTAPPEISISTRGAR